MLVYSSNGSLPDGYYYWNGTSWRLIETTQLNAVSKTTTTLISKTENLVFASNDIKLTLPVISSSDDGLAITIKNIGTHKNLVVIKGSGSTTIDGKDSSNLTRWKGKTFIAYNGNWVLKEKEEVPQHLLDVSPGGSWTTIEEAIEFLNIHMTGPSVVRLSGGSIPLAETQVIDLDFPLTIQSLSFGQATIEAAPGLSGPMFSCISECYFKMLAFDATTLSGYSNTAGNDAIQLNTPEEYYEIKDCNFKGFNIAIVLKSNVELWLFETDINDAVSAGVQIEAGTPTKYVSFKTSETDFINCPKGINLLSGDSAIISILNCGFYNSTGQTGVNYVPASFTRFKSMFITNNSWNNIGNIFNGFDFTLTSGRDAQAFIQGNAGVADKNPNCTINVLNSTTNTSLATLNTWYKVDWGTNSSSQTCKWTINNNKITYQSTNKRNGWIIISGNVSASANSQNITVGIVKNGVSTTQYGTTTIRTVTSDQPFPFSMIVYLTDIGPTDFFELYALNETSSGKTVRFQDIQWLVNTQ
jgi:hypothetical protein